MSKCTFRINQTEENAKKQESIKSQITAYNSSIQKLESSIEKLKPMIEDIKEYTTDKRSQSRNAVNQVLLAAGNIVPASDQKIKFCMEQGEAWFETSDGLSLDRVEGSGYRATLSMFMRDIYLQFNSQYLQTLILDEIFAKLSPERSAVLSTYLPVLAEHIQIISIEQKPEVFADAECTSYSFTLEDGITRVRKD